MPDDDDRGDGFRPIGEVAIRPRQPPPTLPALEPVEPKLSPELAHWMDRATPHPEAGLRGVVLPDGLRREAQQAAARYEQLAQPASPQIIMNFLVGINVGLDQPLEKDVFLERAAVLRESLRTIPAGVFNSGNRVLAQKHFKWFPGVANLHEFLEPLAAPVIGKRWRLRLLLETRPEDRGEAIPKEQREQIVQDFRERLAQVKAGRAEDVLASNMPPPQPRHLSRAELIAAYRAQAKHSNPLIASAGQVRLRALGVNAPEPEQAAPEVVSDHDDHRW